jgi:branched-chain amino acid transport system substrate-binding protein
LIGVRRLPSARYLNDEKEKLMRRKATRMTRWLAVGAVVSTALAVSACGSSGSKAAGDNRPVLKIGLIGQFTGNFAASFGGQPTVLEAWASTVNAAGGVNGAKVQIITKDTAVGVQPGLAYATELVESDHVVLIVNADQSPDDATWLPYAQSKQIPVISTNAGSATLTDPVSFPVHTSTAYSVWAFLETAAKAGPKFGMGYCVETANCIGAAKLLQSVAPSMGVQVGTLVAVSSTAPDYTDICQNFKSVDSYYVVVAGDAAKRVQDTCSQQGIKAPQILSASTASDYWHTDSAFANSPVVGDTAAYFDTSIPAVKQYRDALGKYAKSVPGSTLDNATSMLGWVAGKLIQAAANGSPGDVTAASLLTGIYALKGETLDGLTQPLTYVKGVPTTLYCGVRWKIGAKNVFENPDKSLHCATPAVLDPIVKTLTGK